ncbi:hypothetical protein CEUSTIGMA_g8318.t1 [Chlamydomonas eustigma]|uniref:peptidylprolyl isomerase n=1 Tax=Chlamydomonas eustigma TaxID=1157962 RepID=A0A250XCS1_9CHLO|nr:hypothetical protein CEUSTIGMA_g8318.t1 [Chlamydomonas eustigma]|eukprot:GAX80883.1 hypothetical protein CEUSTIGMA_g8318.t1 [Chlamydomonas eustigma]
MTYCDYSLSMRSSSGVCTSSNRTSSCILSRREFRDRRSSCITKANFEDAAKRSIILSAPLVALSTLASKGAVAAEQMLDTVTPMTALQDKDYGKTRLKYGDFTATPSGLQYKDYKEGSGEVPSPGDMVVFDWDGYTIGYYGRPFEARNKPKGSSFNDDKKDFVRFVLGKGDMIPAFEEALSTMKVGMVRRIIVPEELGYPYDNWRTKGPQPSTFAGERALGFVLENRGMIDKTLMFTIGLRNIVKT